MLMSVTCEPTDKQNYNIDDDKCQSYETIDGCRENLPSLQSTGLSKVVWKIDISMGGKKEQQNLVPARSIGVKLKIVILSKKHQFCFFFFLSFIFCEFLRVGIVIIFIISRSIV